MADSTHIELELLSLMNKLKAEIDSDQKEVHARTSRMAANEALLKAAKASLAARHPEQNADGYGAKAETIRNAIRSITSTRFTQDDVETVIRKVNPDMEINRSRLRSALWTLADKGELIRQAAKGTNSSPAIFEKIAASNGTNNGHPTNEANRLARGIATNTGVITVGDFEAFVREKSRRLADLCTHFKVESKTIQSLLEPETKVYLGEKGWYSIRE